MYLTSPEFSTGRLALARHLYNIGTARTGILPPTHLIALLMTAMFLHLTHSHLRFNDWTPLTSRLVPCIGFVLPNINLEPGQITRHSLQRRGKKVKLEVIKNNWSSEQLYFLILSTKCHYSVMCVLCLRHITKWPVAICSNKSFEKIAQNSYSSYQDPTL